LKLAEKSIIICQKYVPSKRDQRDSSQPKGTFLDPFEL
jgi:hypothetical protein